MTTTVLTQSTSETILGGRMNMPMDANYLADAVILLRYYEIKGEVRQAISVMKKRGGPRERIIRDFKMKNGGIHAGVPLCEFRGVLTGVPVHDMVEDNLGEENRP